MSVEPAQLSGTVGEILTVAVVIESGESPVGSYGATVAWDPAVLAFVNYVGGEPPFDTPIVNVADSALGIVRASDAATDAPAGRNVVLEMTVQLVGQPPSTSVIDVDWTSVFEAQTFANVTGVSTDLDATSCVTDFAYDLRLVGASSTVLVWESLPDASQYDVIRGRLAEFVNASGVIDLGGVECLEAGSLDTTTGLGTEDANPDTDVPLSGEGYFYIVRFRGTGGPATYGYSRECASERRPAYGDCESARHAD